MSLGVDSIENYPSPKKMFFFFMRLMHMCFGSRTVVCSTSERLVFRPRVSYCFDLGSVSLSFHLVSGKWIPTLLKKEHWRRPSTSILNFDAEPREGSSIGKQVVELRTFSLNDAKELFIR